MGSGKQVGRGRIWIEHGEDGGGRDRKKEEDMIGSSK
jgi:hypothetical protein